MSNIGAKRISSIAIVYRLVFCAELLTNVFLLYDTGNLYHDSITSITTRQMNRGFSSSKNSKESRWFLR